MVVVCAVCEKEFEGKRSTARYCGDRCRKLSHRRTPTEPAKTPTRSSLADAVTRELKAAKRDKTFSGQLAIQLATQVSAAGATGIAGLSKELRTVMAEALADVPGPTAPGVEDEVAKARAARDAIARNAAG